MGWSAFLALDGPVATLHLAGRPAEAEVEELAPLLRQLTERSPDRLVIRASGLEWLPAAAVRSLLVAAQHNAVPLDLLLVDANERVRATFERAGLDGSIVVAGASG